MPAGQHLGDELYSLPLNKHPAQWSKRQDSTKLTGITLVCNLSRGFNQPETSSLMPFARYWSFTGEFFFFTAEEAAAETLLRGLPLLISVPAV